MRKTKIFSCILAALCLISCTAGCSGLKPSLVSGESSQESIPSKAEIPNEQSDMLTEESSTATSSKDESSQILLRKINPFEKLKLTYTGAAPYISVSTDSTLCDETVNQYINFKIDKENNLRNGDTFTVTATYNEYELQQNGFELISDSKTYTVQNQPEFIKTVEELDLTAMQSEIDDKLAVVTAANDKDSGFADVYIGYCNYKSVASKKLKSTYLISLKNAFEDKYSREPYNRYMQIYEYTINTYDENNPTRKIYVMIYVNNVRSLPDGTLSWDNELVNHGYDNYDSMINDHVISRREFYNVTEVN